MTQRQPSSPGPARPAGPGFAFAFFTAMLCGFVALLMWRPENIGRQVENDRGPVLGGLSVGLALALVMLVVPIVLAAAHRSRRD